MSADWTEFDAAVAAALALWFQRTAWFAVKDREYGMTFFTPRLSGGAGLDWKPEDKQKARDLINAAQDAEAHALTLRPKRTHYRTAVRRLRQIMADS